MVLCHAKARKGKIYVNCLLRCIIIGLADKYIVILKMSIRNVNKYILL